MIVIPAIDLKRGKCVRLSQGDFAQVVVYGDDPVQVARNWREQGAERIHVVDLDGSLAGFPQNGEFIKAIVRDTDLPVQVGGGIRDMASIESYMRMGVRWVILGTSALKNEVFVREACLAFEDRIILGIDARDGKVAIRGWTEETLISPRELAERYHNKGIAAIIYTDIKRDGMETGVNVDATEALARTGRVPVIASGGVAGIEDIKKLATIEKSGVVGVIIGKALYSGALSLAEAIRAASPQKG